MLSGSRVLPRHGAHCQRAQNRSLDKAPRGRRERLPSRLDSLVRRTPLRPPIEGLLARLTDIQGEPLAQLSARRVEVEQPPLELRWNDGVVPEPHTAGPVDSGYPTSRAVTATAILPPELFPAVSCMEQPHGRCGQTPSCYPREPPSVLRHRAAPVSPEPKPAPPKERRARPHQGDHARSMLSPKLSTQSAGRRRKQQCGHARPRIRPGRPYP